MGSTWKSILTWLCVGVAVVLVIAIIFLLIFPTNPEYRRFRNALKELQSQETVYYTFVSPDKALDRETGTYEEKRSASGDEFLANKEGFFSPKNMICQTDGENTIYQFEVDNGANNCTASRSITEYTFTLDAENNIVMMVEETTNYRGSYVDPEKISSVSRYFYIFS